MSWVGGGGATRFPRAGAVSTHPASRISHPVSEPTLFQGSGKGRSGEPLAARMRPTTLEDFLGQEHLLGPGKALGELIRRGDVGSCIFWGPPGSGKTTLARLVANYTARQFEPFSAVTEGVARVREIIQQAEERLKYEGRGTILFCDEIHRFNRAQQDAFLPWVENGIITLIGATTENPSFELTAPLLSRCRVFVLEPLKPADIATILRRALAQTGCEMREAGCVSPEGVEALVTYAQDVALADARAPTPARAPKDASHSLRRPEGELARAEAVVYLATAPTSNRVYTAFAHAMDAAAAHPTEAVPLHIRNAPTKLMEELGYGAGYQYAHAFEHAYVPQEYLPDSLRGASWYQPTAAGYEKTIGERMEFWKQLKEKLLRDAGSGRREG